MSKTPTVLERLESLENSNRQLQEGLDTVFEQFRGALQSEMEVVQAMAEVLKTSDAEFTNKVQTTIDNNRRARDQARAEQEKKQLAQLVESGSYKSVDTIGEQSLLVGRVFGPEGEVRGSGRVQLNFSALDPNVKPSFLGQGVGFVFEAPSTKEKLEILEVYDPVPAPAPLQVVPDVATESKE